jgi:hypothetical protein
MPRYRTTAIAFGSVIVAAWLLLSFPVPGSTPTSPGPAHLADSVTSPCGGTVLPHNYSGTVEWNGANAGSSVPIRFSYDAQIMTNLTDGVVLSTVCSALNGTVTPDGAGTFALSIDGAQNTSCRFPGGGGAGTCVTTTGPYESVDVVPLGTPPPGYVHSVEQNGTTFAVDVYSDLASVQLGPDSSPATFSTSAVDELDATPMTGAGTPTAATPDFTWALSGVGWSFVGPTNGSTVDVTAAPDAGIGNLSVVAELWVDAALLETPAASEQLVARSTAIASASVNRTVVDAGQSLAVTVDASGAPGYPYSATIFPGLGVAPSPAPCVVASEPGGVVALACTGYVAYPATGVAQPAVAVTNGASSASWVFPEVTVNPAPSVVVLPGTPVGYAGVPLPIELTAAAGTGTAPYERACLATGTGPISCQVSPGPAWAFRPTFPSAGDYTVHGWIIDATGTNRSASAYVTVDVSPSVAFVPTALSISAGSPIQVHAILAGGALPAHLWWNLSGASVPVATGSAGTDGTVSAVFEATAVGYATLTVTAVDRLGTAVSASITFSVDAGAATSVAPAGPPPPASVIAGTSFNIEWRALDAVGIPVDSFASEAEIELALPGTEGAAGGWVNASGLGPLTGTLPGWFHVPTAAWVNGALAVNVTVLTAGPVRVELALANGFAATNDSVPVLVGADLSQLRLSDPESVRGGGSANDTLWQVSDRFGNPALGAAVVTTATFNGRGSVTLSTAFAEPRGSTAVWVNYTVPAGEGGTVTVTDLAGQALVPTLTVPAPTSAWSSVLPILPLVGIAGAALVVSLVAGRTRRRVPTRSFADEESVLQQLAEGRATVVEVVRRQGPIDLAGISTVWGSTPPPDALADWVASLLTDGTLDARFGDDGVARFVLAEPSVPDARVTVDVAEFDRGEAAREAARTDWESEDDP